MSSKAHKIVTEVISELDGRGGFDHWWGGIEEDIQEEILEALYVRVEKALDG